jgi:Single-strand binding protein family
MSVNKAIIIGNLGRDPAIRALPSGQSVANFQSPPRRDSRIATASSGSTPNGFVQLPSASSQTIASACCARAAVAPKLASINGFATFYQINNPLG